MTGKDKMARLEKQKELRRILREGSLEAIVSDGGSILFGDRNDSMAVFRFCAGKKVVKRRKEFDRMFRRYYKRYRTMKEYSKKDALTHFLTDMEAGHLIEEGRDYLDEVSRMPRNLFRGVKEALAEISSAGIPFIIMTDAGRSGEDLKKYLPEWGIEDYVTDIVSSVDAGETKPSPAFFDYVIEKHNINPGRFVFVAHAKDELEGACHLGYAVLACRPDRGVKGTGYIEVPSFRQVPEALKLDRAA